MAKHVLPHLSLGAAAAEPTPPRAAGPEEEKAGEEKAAKRQPCRSDPQRECWVVQP